jgi:hypothetical protein
MQVHVVVVTFARASQHFESAFFERPELASYLIVRAIKTGEIQEMSVLIHLEIKKNKETLFHFLKMPSSKQRKKKTADLLHPAQTAVSSARGSGTGKLHTTLLKLGVKRVVLGNVDGHTLAVTKVILSKKLTVIRATWDW